MPYTPSKILRELYIPTAEFYSQIIDSLQDYSIFTFDNDLKINSWNSGAEKIFKYKTDEIIGKPFEIIFTEEDKIAGIPNLEVVTAQREGKAADNRWHTCKHGTRFFANGLVFPLMSKEGDLLGYVKILRDLTVAKNSEESVSKYVKELEELNAHKENILAMLSHDLRGPLTSIIGMADYLQSDYETMEPAAIKEMLGFIYKASRAELNMLDYILEWARIKYAADTFSPTKIDLSLHVLKVFETLNPTATENSITLINEIMPLTEAYCDGKMILSVLQNLISNAIKHSSIKGNIVVSSKSETDKIIVQIKDFGLGMTEEILKSIFTPQLKSLSKARKGEKGAGIGLLLAKGFLEKNNGEIWVESKEGEGTSFYFSLPTEKPIEKIESILKTDNSASIE